jgi:hypothetical protein
MHSGVEQPHSNLRRGLSPLFGYRISLIAGPHQTPFGASERCPHSWHRQSGRRFAKCLLKLLMKSSQPDFQGRPKFLRSRPKPKLNWQRNLNRRISNGATLGQYRPGRRGKYAQTEWGGRRGSDPLPPEPQSGCLPG